MLLASAALAASGRWTAPKQIDSGDGSGETDLSGVSCTSSSFCVAVDSYGHALTYNGARWTKRVAVVPSPYHLWDVSCSSPSFCLAGSDDGAAIYDGTTWSIAPSPPGLVGVACQSSSFCVGLVARGAAIYNGVTWSKPVRIDTDPRRFVVDSISCGSVSFCVATEGSSFAPGAPIVATIYGGTSWSKPKVIDARPGLLSASVSCPSRSFCLAVDDEANAMKYNGRTWSAPTKVASGYGTGGKALTHVACASSSFCVAIDNGGAALTYDGRAWSKPMQVNFQRGGGYQLLSSVSCPSSAFCVAVGGLNAVIYRARG
jgi:hypothetical protein